MEMAKEMGMDNMDMVTEKVGNNSKGNKEATPIDFGMAFLISNYYSFLSPNL